MPAQTSSRSRKTLLVRRGRRAKRVMLGIIAFIITPCITISTIITSIVTITSIIFGFRAESLGDNPLPNVEPPHPPSY